MSQVKDNPEKKRFELPVGNTLAFAAYRVDKDGKIVSITHVETPPELRGQGVAGNLMEGIVGIIRTNGQKILPICPYAVSWLNRHKEHADLLA